MRSRRSSWRPVSQLLVHLWFQLPLQQKSPGELRLSPIVKLPVTPPACALCVPTFLKCGELASLGFSTHPEKTGSGRCCFVLPWADGQFSRAFCILLRGLHRCKASWPTAVTLKAYIWLAFSLSLSYSPACLIHVFWDHLPSKTTWTQTPFSGSAFRNSSIFLGLLVFVVNRIRK